MIGEIGCNYPLTDEERRCLIAASKAQVTSLQNQMARCNFLFLNQHMCQLLKMIAQIVWTSDIILGYNCTWKIWDIMIIFGVSTLFVFQPVLKLWCQQIAKSSTRKATEISLLPCHIVGLNKVCFCWRLHHFSSVNFRVSQKRYPLLIG